jgi:hypothetical protein
MRQPQSNSPGEIRPESIGPRNHLFVFLGALSLLFLYIAANPSSVRAAWGGLARIIHLKGHPLSASSAKLSDYEIEELPSMPPQKQAELLIERAINHYDGAFGLIEKYVPGWYDQIDVSKGRLAALLNTAINSNDLRVRAASLEITLAGYNLPKTPQSVDSILSRLQNEPEHRAWFLWILGVLGNRGVESQRIETVFLDRIHHPDETVRFYAVTGLGMLATDESIRPLLNAFREDPSPHVREGAGCSLAQSGMFTPSQRLRAVPDLLSMMDDPTLDSPTRGWVFQALRDITGASLGSDPAAWRDWWSRHGQR